MNQSERNQPLTFNTVPLLGASATLSKIDNQRNQSQSIKKKAS